MNSIFGLMEKILRINPLVDENADASNTYFLYVVCHFNLGCKRMQVVYKDFM